MQKKKGAGELGTWMWLQVAQYLVPRIRDVLISRGNSSTYIRFLTGPKAYVQILSVSILDIRNPIYCAHLVEMSLGHHYMRSLYIGTHAETYQAWLRFVTIEGQRLMTNW